MRKRVLVVGAGPVGLSAALFLSKLPNTQITIIQKKAHREKQILTKAININCRTLSIFKQQNPALLQKIIAKSHRIMSIEVYDKQKLLFEANIRLILKSRTQFPHLYQLPQGMTQGLIQQQLNNQGLTVRMGTEVINLTESSFKKQTTVHFLNAPNKTDYRQKFDCIFAADGAHSKCRQLLGLKMQGETLPQKLYLCDTLVKEGHPSAFRTYLFDHKTYFIIPIRPGLVRIAANFESIMDYLPSSYQAEGVLWKSVENINNRTIEKMSVGNTYFIGDAAHVHASLGGRGMNAGIQDAYILSKLYQKDRLHDYHSIRKPKVDYFVNRIKFASSIFLSYKHPGFKRVSPYIAKYLKGLALPEILKFSGGIDYNLPQI